jgi:hypothetical protein
MKQAKLNDDGDLFFILKEGYDKDAVVVYQLDNDAGIEFIDGECVAVVLPSFVAKLNRGNIQSVELESFDIIDVSLILTYI